MGEVNCIQFRAHLGCMFSFTEVRKSFLKSQFVQPFQKNIPPEAHCRSAFGPEAHASNTLFTHTQTSPGVHIHQNPQGLLRRVAVVKVDAFGEDFAHFVHGGGSWDFEHRDLSVFVPEARNVRIFRT